MYNVHTHFAVHYDIERIVDHFAVRSNTSQHQDRAFILSFRPGNIAVKCAENIR